MTYQVKLEKFEGPLELLLELIEKEKLNIAELSLAKVADEYLSYIRGNSSIALENLADFLTVASKLILIKSRALLPMLKVTPEEEEEIKDLEKQLAEYKKFKEAAAELGKLANSKKISYAREGYLGVKSVFYPPENINVFDLKKHFLAVLAEIPVLEILQEEIVSEVVTLEERISQLANLLELRLESSFSELVSSAQDKVDVIISFLAMLEMIKQRIVEVEQQNLFEEIQLKINPTLFQRTQ